MLSLDESSAGQQIELKPGEEAQLALAEKRLSGYRWQIEQSGQPAVTVADQQPTAVPDSAVGGTHMRTFRIRAVEPGTATLLLRHRRSWEPENSGRTFSLSFHVAG